MVATIVADKEETEDKNRSADSDKAMPQTAYSNVVAGAITDRGGDGSPGPPIPGADPHGSSLTAMEDTVPQVVR